MVIENIGNRGTLFTFKGEETPMTYPTSVYVINGRKHIFICDTHVGPKSMEPVIEYIRKNFSTKRLIIFNTHSDYDHVWGNGAFIGENIIAHKLCREELIEKGELSLAANAQYKYGDVENVLPNITFSHKITFEEDQVEFYYAPGHTIDSSVCHDISEKTLFVGDLIETPIPYLAYHRLDLFLGTLESIKNMHLNYIVSGHSGVVDHYIINKNIEYIKDVMNNGSVSFDIKEAEQVHEYNLKALLASKYEEKIKEISRDKFDVKLYFKIVSDNMHKTREELERALKAYVSSN